MEEANWKKFQSCLVAATTEKTNIKLLFSSCRCTQKFELKVEWQMVFLLKKVNINFINGIALLAALHWVKNFKFCNKHQTFLTIYLDFVPKKVFKEDIILLLDGIW